MRLNFKTTMPFDKKRATNFEEKILGGTKIHTLRQSDRIKVGMKLQMTVGSRYKPRVFAEKVCVSTQLAKIILKYDPAIGLFGLDIYVTYTTKSDAYLNPEELQVFVKNDGFDTLEHFVDWFFPNRNAVEGFNKMETLNVIHWTDLKY